MRQCRSKSRGEQAFTLVELMAAGMVAGIILGATVFAGATLQRSFAASDMTLKASMDQSRVLDYIVRDVRRALTVSVTNGGQMLTLTIPDYVDWTTPAVPKKKKAAVKHINSKLGKPKGQVDYGDPLNPVTVIYFPANDKTGSAYTYAANGKYIIRQEGTTQVVISKDCTTLQLNCTDNTDSVTTSISYSPRFNFSDRSAVRAATTIYATTNLRNTRRN